MRARILKPEEMKRLAAVKAPMMPLVEPHNVAACVVEDDAGEIIASLLVLRLSCVEGLWIAPAYKKHPGVLRSLLRLAWAVPQARDEHWMIGGASDDSPKMNDFVTRLGGVPLPLKYYVLSTGVDQCQQQ